jgi:hypothetical protein
MQDISIVTCKESQEIVERSNLNLVDLFMESNVDLLEHPGLLPWIETIDPYGITLYNAMQVEYLIKDFRKLKMVEKEEKMKKFIDETITFAQKVIDGIPNLYLKFIGD